MRGDKMDLPMRADLKVGSIFPDIELPDQTGTVRKLSELLSGFPGILAFSRGHYCPKDRRQFSNYVKDLQPELRVNYCKLITISVDGRLATNEVRDSLGAEWPFLCDPDRRLLHELEMVDTTDPEHGEVYIPYTFVLGPDRNIYKIYNGWWFVGRPTVEELRMDLRALMSRRPDWVYPVERDKDGLAAD
jgi:peroxiredoxin